MTKRTMTADEREWEEGREARWQWTVRQLNKTWRDVQAQEATKERSTMRRRLFPWRIHIERLN